MSSPSVGTDTVGHGESGSRTATILAIIPTCISHELNPGAYLHLGTKLILGGWPNKKLRDLLPIRIAVLHPEVLAKHKDAAIALSASITPLLG